MTSPSDPAVIIAGIRRFGLASDGADLRDLEAAIARLRASPASDADMRAFSASDAACYKWPEDTSEHRAARAAYCEGAADYGSSPVDAPARDDTTSMADRMERADAVGLRYRDMRDWHYLTHDERALIVAALRVRSQP